MGLFTTPSTHVSFIHLIMASASYVKPSAATTGVFMNLRVIGQRKFEGGDWTRACCGVLFKEV